MSMASYFLRQNKITSFLRAVNQTNISLTLNRSIMTSRMKLEKVMENLEKNPYFEKYAQKISQLQKTSPEEFLQRIEEKERKVKEEKVFSNDPKQMQKSPWSWSIMSQLWKSNIIQKRNSVRAYSQIAAEKKYITTPIFYVNAAPHIGHLYTAVLADSIARFNLMQGHETLLNTGTDEHGKKVEKAAESLKIPTDIYCQKISQEFKKMCDTFNINYTNFIRTTNPTHHKTVQYFWRLLERKNFIYKGKYSGWYCTSDEAFVSNIDLTEIKTPGGEIIKVSAESGNTVEWIEEDNYKFRLSTFQDDLKHWLKNDKVVQPSVFHKILSQWIEDESIMQDLSVSRPINRVSWGIPTPNDPNQIIYVWLDALVNYLSSLEYPKDTFETFWPPTVQVIGKDILKFHGIYWPAFLIAAGLEPPKTLLCHSHWTVNGEKMSKSKGNVVSPFDAAEQFTTEGLRYFLLRDSVPYNDANYSSKRVQEILNSELANTLGNIVRRCTSRAINPRNEIPSARMYAKALQSEAAETLRKNMETLGDTAKKHYESFNVHHAVDAVVTTLKSANVMIDHHKPWVLKNQDHDEMAMVELKSVITLALEASRISALVLYPVIPTISSNLLDVLNVPMTERHWKDTEPKYFDEQASRESDYIINNNTMIFARLKA